MWKQGEHVLICGETGSGKTGLVRALGLKRQYVVMLANKSDDYLWPKFKRVKRWSEINVRKGGRWRLQPERVDRGMEFSLALEGMYEQGGWTELIDELYALKYVGCEPEAVMNLTEGRSQRITCVCGVQRPSWITRFAFSETKYIASFGLGDQRDLKALEEITGSRQFSREVAELGQYQIALYKKRTREIVVGTRQQIVEAITG